MNIPVYRGKRVDNSEYVMGWYSDPILIEGKLYLSITNKEGTFRIDPTTLAIHFPDMLDSEGNKIFASLSEDGKGGTNIIDEDVDIATCIFYNSFCQFRYINNGNIGAKYIPSEIKII